VPYNKTHRENYTYSYSFFILRTEFHVARIQIKFCRIYPHYMKGRAGLMKIMLK